MYCSLHCGSLVKRAAICAATYGVSIWFGGSLYVLQFTLCQFGVADCFMYCNLHFVRLV